MMGIGRHVKIMVAGSAIGQVVPLLVMPILTRLYEPSQFGVFSTVLALSAVLAIPATLRYELAIVLPKDDGEAMSLAALAAGLSVAFAILLLAATAIGGSTLPDVAGVRALGSWLFAVPAVVLLLAWQQILVCLSNRFRSYGSIVLGTVAYQGVAAAGAILVGLWQATIGGLLFSRIFGLGAGGALLAWRRARDIMRLRRQVSRAGIRRAAWNYRQFPSFNVLYSLAGVLSREFPIVMFSSFGHLEFAGLFGLAKTAAYAPVNFLTSSLSQVFYREAAEHLGKDEFAALVWRAMRGLAVALVPGAVVVALGAQPLITGIFGPKWAQAGEILAILIPQAVLGFFTGWPERVFEASRKQQWALAVQLTFDAAVFVILPLTLIGGADLVTIVYIYAGIQVTYQTTYLALIFRLTRLPSRRFFELLATILGLAAATYCVHQALLQLSVPRLTLGVELAAAGAVFAVALRYIARHSS